MSKNSKVNRRSFVQGQMALAAAVSLGATAHAGDPVSRDWTTAKARQFSKLKGQSFTARDQSGNIVHLKLAIVEQHGYRGSRPSNLARRSGMTLVFDCDCAEDLAAQGHQTVWIHHPELGQSQLFLGAVPRRDGSYEIEAILN